METSKVFDWVERHKKTIQRSLIPTLLVMVALVSILVYMTGGVKYVYSQLMYIPILLAGTFFGLKGGLLMGLIAGLALGPHMPINVVTNEMQPAENWLYRAGFFILIGGGSGYISSSVARYLSHFKWLSQHNPSTGLPNRNALFEAIKDLKERNEMTSATTLAIIAIDNTLELKSAFGFNVIEHATKQVARRLALNGGDDIFHTDSAEVAIILNKGEEENTKFLNNLGVLLQEAVIYNQISVHVETRAGYVCFGDGKQSPEVYLHQAEAALALVQELAQDIKAYNPEVVSRTERSISILGQLQKGLETGQVGLHYQPKIDLVTGQICSVEALLRWKHPEKGMIAPGSFIPRAEQSTLIQGITEFALEEAINQHLKWKNQGILIPVAVNISTRNLLYPKFTDRVVAMLEKFAIDGQWIELELTEGSLVMDMEETIEQLTKLANANFSISIDDFGTGYSSLQYLHRLPASLIKIDQTFIKRLPDDKGAAYIVDAAVTLAKKMGIKTIAEGVETAAVFEYLQNTGCDMAQGHYISPAIPQEQFTRWYLSRNGIYASMA
ncbi:MAG: GGDEF domain-containing protein [Rickettsiales bacterium]|jgi:EAL domain-containing protein (putative c-di-GMP-specific phosphodiesterase class I)/GGDEF domain-containing protein|nr:GGDEF domain-containing protein [Rickettsiales bacterium]